ncbi:LysE/ArgO family amino acid transporter [Profundibacter sp.]|uniref:LysE/ArgO family amino acid transporter n=1 Tax=Profundibacter sp. TaxID=3101071 RepID=UPI003D1303F8
MQTFTAGFILSFSLILAIGAQNAFVLRQGLRREHVFAICFVSGLSDAILIAIGVSSFGVVSILIPWLAPAFLYAGAAFLIWYGWQNFRAVLRGGQALAASDIQANSLKKTMLTALAMVWLNPHAWLDTVVLVGSVSTKYDDGVMFAAGATLASFTFFFALGYGARLLAPLFAKPVAWRVLDGVVALTMWIIAASLLLE